MCGTDAVLAIVDGASRGWGTFAAAAAPCAFRMWISRARGVLGTNPTARVADLARPPGTQLAVDGAIACAAAAPFSSAAR
jgi:hypothetical protein